LESGGRNHAGQVRAPVFQPEMVIRRQGAQRFLHTRFEGAALLHLRYLPGSQAILGQGRQPGALRQPVARLAMRLVDGNVIQSKEEVLKREDR